MTVIDLLFRNMVKAMAKLSGHGPKIIMTLLFVCFLLSLIVAGYYTSRMAHMQFSMEFLEEKYQESLKKNTILEESEKKVSLFSAKFGLNHNPDSYSDLMQQLDKIDKNVLTKNDREDIATAIVAIDQSKRHVIAAASQLRDIACNVGTHFGIFDNAKSRCDALKNGLEKPLTPTISSNSSGVVSSNNTNIELDNIDETASIIIILRIDLARTVKFYSAFLLPINFGFLGACIFAMWSLLLLLRESKEEGKNGRPYGAVATVIDGCNSPSAPSAQSTEIPPPNPAMDQVKIDGIPQTEGQPMLEHARRVAPVIDWSLALKYWLHACLGGVCGLIVGYVNLQATGITYSPLFLSLVSGFSVDTIISILDRIANSLSYDKEIVDKANQTRG